MAQNAAVQGSEGHKKSFPPLDPSTFAPQLIWLAIAFGLLYLLLRRFILPRVGEIVEERSECIKRDLAQAEKLKTDTATALASYGQALADARAKASDVVKAFREKIATEVDQERMKAEAEIAAKLVEAEKRIAAAKAKGLADTSDIAGEIAGAVVVRLIGEEVRKDEVERALSREAAE
jgi:F-type H+-transporting ATPase subunit b